MDTWIIVVIVIVAIVVILAVSIIGWWISTMNWFRRTKVKVDESLSGVDVALTKRYDLLTKLLSATKGYAKHEYETLVGVISLRGNGEKDGGKELKSSDDLKNLNLDQKGELNSRLNEVQKGLNIMVENYPNLKADSTFNNLMNQTGEVEERLQASRRVYNSNVSSFNQKRVSFPASIVAHHIGFNNDLEFFKADEEKRADVKFDF